MAGSPKPVAARVGQTPRLLYTHNLAQHQKLGMRQLSAGQAVGRDGCLLKTASQTTHQVCQKGQWLKFVAAKGRFYGSILQQVQIQYAGVLMVR